MQVLIIKLADGSVTRLQRADADYAKADPVKTVEHMALMQGTPPLAVVSSALCDFELVRGVPLANVDIVDGVVVINRLPSAKQQALEAVDDKTRLGIAAGFVYDGKTCSLSANAQNSLTGVWALRDVPDTFPIDWPTKDGLGSITLANQEAFEAFFATAFAVVRTNRSIGVAVKALITAATTVEAVAAALATDTR
jgi:hypothetical protein